MKTVALISGGKDSCFNMMCCVAEGHEIVALANLRPEKDGQQELDSYMFQTVGHTAIDLYAEALGLPLYVQSISGTSLSTEGDYKPQEGDEVEDLYKLLQAVKDDITVEAVSVGAILSDYQRVRVENVCGRLGLTVLSFLWRRNQEELLKEMIDCGVRAKIIKVAAMGLKPDQHLGLELSDIQPHMLSMKSKYGLNVCGEGGEYETFVFDCPLFQQKIQLDIMEMVIHSDDAFAPVGYLVLKSCSLVPKPVMDTNSSLQDKIQHLPILTKDKWLARHQFETTKKNDQTNQEHDAKAEGGGGDYGPTMFMCVPDIQMTGQEKPNFKSDGRYFQVSGIRAIVGRDTELSTVTETAMNSLKECLGIHNIKMEEILSVSLCVGSMSNFAAINNVYKLFFDLNPPVRVCIEANLPRNVALQLDCHGCTNKDPNVNSAEAIQIEKKVLHVQALSHWAPANIGPYSQAVMTDGKLYMAGIVPLVPASLEVVEGGIVAQASLALTHVQTVMSAIAPNCSLECCPMVICYLTRADFIDTAHDIWMKALKTSSPDRDWEENDGQHIIPRVQFVQVSALPKACLVEWHAMAWPGLGDSSITEVREVRKFGNHCISASAQYCHDKPNFFSCSITIEMSSIDSIQHVDKLGLPAQMVELYCLVRCRCLGLTAAGSLVKIFFSPTVYDYIALHKYFDDAVRGICPSKSVPEPMLSLIPVSGLDSRKQILAWCQ